MLSVSNNTIVKMLDIFNQLSNNKNFTCTYYSINNKSIISTYTRINGNLEINISDNTVPAEPLTLGDFKRTFKQCFYDTDYIHVILYNFNKTDFIILCIDN